VDIKTCACGCGLTVKNEYRQGHWAKSDKGRKRLRAARYKAAKCNHGDGYITINSNGRHRLEHIVVAENVIGITLPKEAVMHHVNHDRADNRPGNLVVCPNPAYHALIHSRERALDACGNADWRKCSFCGEYDKPGNLYIPPNRGTIEHRACGRLYRIERAEINGRKHDGRL